jgi:hypothetical protein
MRALHRLLLLAPAVSVVSCRGSDRYDPSQQSAIQAWLVVHVEPLSRQRDVDCQDPRLSECGLPVADSWERRSENLVWLLDRWEEAGRRMELQLGPEAARSWSGDEALATALVESFRVDGDREGLVLSEQEAQSRFSERVAGVQEALTSAVVGGSVELGVHVHTVLPDPSGQWGTAPKGREPGGVGPCEAWADEPLAEGEASVVEEVVAYGVESAVPLAEASGVPLLSFTGHLPRSMAGKIQVVEDPDGLDEGLSRSFSPLFRPSNLGSAYSECLHRIADHPPLEPWPADSQSSLASGSGPVVVPGERVIGAMDEHLDVWADTSASAAARRLIQLMLNWRMAGLRGEAERPWVFTFHSHLYQLNPGTPAPLDPTAREAGTREGGMLRGDLEALSGWIDRLSSWSEVSGVASSEGSILQWTMPSELNTEGSGFVLGRSDEAPVQELDSSSFPYLALVAERLSQTHLVCEGQLDGVTLFGFSRCPGGWTWGQPGPGYGCQGQQAPDGVFVLLAPESTCVHVPSAALQTAALDAPVMGAAEWCDSESLMVPREGLIVEPATGLQWLSDSCMAWR